MSRGKGNDTNNDKGRGRGRGRASASGPPGFEDFQASPNLLKSGFRFPKSTKSGFCFNPDVHPFESRIAQLGSATGK